MRKAKRLLKNTRVIILLVFLVLALVAINPKLQADGVAIRSIVKDSAAFAAGIESPEPTTTPTSREVIEAVDNKPIESEADFFTSVKGLEINDTVLIRTNKQLYRLTVQPLTEIIELNETEIQLVNETIEVQEDINGTNTTVNKTIQKEVEVNKTETNIIGVEELGLRVYPAPQNNIRKGLDLQGGTRVLLKPEEKLNPDDMEILLSNMKERLNVYGLSDLIIRKTTDLAGEQFILVEIAGASEEEVEDLVGKQGKFEAKIGDSVVFVGGKDITYVCRSAECAGIDPNSGCGPTGDNQFACRFRFVISLTPEAAQIHADITKKLDVVNLDGQQYLSEQLDLYLDNEQVDQLNIGSELQGRAITDISISGSGVGASREGAITDALTSMKRLQTILITGSLPVKLEIVKIDAISPLLGEEFVRNTLIVGLLAILSVGVVVFIRYRIIMVSVPIMITMLSEIILLLGFAAVVGWNLDLASIAGIIIAAGTGVDHQIVITDEVLKGKDSSEVYSWRERVKKAFFIIMATYFTTVVAMIPLLFAGAGLIKGFAFTTIVGVTMGVFITRPAFASVIEILLQD
jgi:preprotein translocase subunit SecD